MLVIRKTQKYPPDYPDGIYYEIVIDAEYRSDITDDLQEAAIIVGNCGGTIIIPPEIYRISRPVVFHHPTAKNTTRNIRLIGNGATLVYDGPDKIDTACLDFPCAYRCLVDGLYLIGEEGRNYQRTAGIRFSGGWEWGFNGGKFNRVNQCIIENFGAGAQVGGYFNPDVVNVLFSQVQVDNCRHAYVIHGANVAMTSFDNCSIGLCDESGFKILANPGCQIRKDESDPQVHPNVLTDWEGNEIFQSQLNDYLRSGTGPTYYQGKTLFIGGGTLALNITSLTAHLELVDSWLVDTNFGHVHIHNARVEGNCGILRANYRIASQGNFESNITGMATTSFGGMRGYAIEQTPATALNITGGTLCAPIGVYSWWHAVRTQWLYGERVNSPTKGYVKPENVNSVGPYVTVDTASPVAKPYGRGKMFPTVSRQPNYPGAVISLR